MTTVSPDALKEVLTWLGLPERAAKNEDYIEHMDVLGDIMAKYFVRNERYKSTWQQYGALSQLVRAAQKIDRLMAVWWYDIDEDRPPLTKDDWDDAEDAINHLIFFIRCARDGNLTGSLPNRPDVDSKAFKMLTGTEEVGEVTEETIEKLKSFTQGREGVVGGPELFHEVEDYPRRLFPVRMPPAHPQLPGIT